MTLAALLLLLIADKRRQGCKQLRVFGTALVDWSDTTQARTRNSIARGHLQSSQCLVLHASRSVEVTWNEPYSSVFAVCSVNGDETMGETHRRTPKSISTWKPTGSWRPLLNREKSLTPLAISQLPKPSKQSGCIHFSNPPEEPAPRQLVCQCTSFFLLHLSMGHTIVIVIRCQHLSPLTQGSSETPQQNKSCSRRGHFQQ